MGNLPNNDSKKEHVAQRSALGTADPLPALGGVTLTCAARFCAARLLVESSLFPFVP